MEWHQVIGCALAALFFWALFDDAARPKDETQRNLSLGCAAVFLFVFFIAVIGRGR
jgi:hypothetical protein